MTVGLPALRKYRKTIVPWPFIFFPANTYPNFQPLHGNAVIFLKAKKISIALTFTFMRHPPAALLWHQNPQYTVAKLRPVSCRTEVIPTQPTCCSRLPFSSSSSHNPGCLYIYIYTHVYRWWWWWRSVNLT